MCISGSYFILQTFALELHSDDSRVNTATPTKDKESMQQSSHIILLYNFLFIFISHHHIYIIFCGHKDEFSLLHGSKSNLLCIPRYVRHESGSSDKVKHDDSIQIPQRCPLDGSQA